MDSKKTPKKSNVNFTKIPNCIVEGLIAGDISPIEFKMITLFLYNKPGFNYSRKYLRNQFTSEALQKYLPILIKNNFLTRDEVHIDRYRTRVNYTVRPVEEWTYFKQSVIKKESKSDGTQEQKMGRLFGQSYGEKLWTTFRPLNKTINITTSLFLNKEKAYNKKHPSSGASQKSEPERQPPPRKRGGVVVENIHGRNYLAGKLRLIYVYGSDKAVASLVTDLRKKYSDHDIYAAIEAVENAQRWNPKQFERFSQDHARLWHEEVEKQAKARQNATQTVENGVGNSQIAPSDKRRSDFIKPDEIEFYKYH